MTAKNSAYNLTLLNKHDRIPDRCNSQKSTLYQIDELWWWLELISWFWHQHHCHKFNCFLRFSQVVISRSKHLNWSKTWYMMMHICLCLMKTKIVKVSRKEVSFYRIDTVFRSFQKGGKLILKKIRNIIQKPCEPRKSWWNQ